MIDKLAMGLITIGGQVYKVAPSVARRLAKEFGIKGATKAQAKKATKPIKLTSANATKLAQGSGKNKPTTLGQDKVSPSSSQKNLKMAQTRQGPRTPKLKKSNLKIQPAKKKPPTGPETKPGIKTGTGTKTTGTGTKTTVKKPLTLPPLSSFLKFIISIVFSLLFYNLFSKLVKTVVPELIFILLEIIVSRHLLVGVQEPQSISTVLPRFFLAMSIRLSYSLTILYTTALFIIYPTFLLLIP